MLQIIPNCYLLKEIMFTFPVFGYNENLIILS
jgi:hypothetical protein